MRDNIKGVQKDFQWSKYGFGVLLSPIDFVYVILAGEGPEGVQEDLSVVRCKFEVLLSPIDFLYVT